MFFGVFSKNSAMEATSKRNLATNVKYLSKMKRYWGMFHWMSENLKEQYRVCADAARQGSNGSNPSSTSVFQYGDWFDRYPHGVSQSDFEDPAVGVQKEKGDDAVLGEKSDYHTVEEFFNTLSPLKPKDREAAKPPKRKAKRTPPVRQEKLNPLRTDMPNIVPAPQLQMQNNQQIPQAYTQMSPTTPVSLYNQDPYYGQDVLLPPQQRGILPQLDRQLVFGAYAGMDPSALASQNMFDNPLSWDMQMGGMTGFVTEPSSAWFMPFNMEPPEIGQEADIFHTLGGAGVGYGLGGMPVDNNGNVMGGGAQGGGG